MRKIFPGPLTTVLACTLLELHVFKVLFYAESVGVVTSGHVTKMAITPLNPQFPKTPCYMQTSRQYLLYLLPTELLHRGNGNFMFFLPKIVKILF